MIPFARTLAAFSAAAFLCACTKVTGPAASSGAGNSWTRPGVLRYAQNADPKSLDPILASSTVVGDLAMFMFSYTVRYDEKAQPHPDALSEVPTVENGDVSKDGLTLKYKLRPNITWHDGAPMTSKDLWFTWKAVMNPHNNVVTTDGYKDIKDIDYSDPHVALIHMKRVYAPYLQQLFGENGNAAILPEHILAKYNDDKGSFNTAPYQSAPVGSGPFKFVSWQRGSEVRMEAYPDFYLGKPKLHEVIFKIMPDENTMVTQLRTHELDMIVHGTGSAWPQYQNIPGTVAIAPPIYTYDHIDFNLKRPLFGDVRMRRALAYAIDRPGILEKVAHGLGTLAPADQSPLLSHAYDPNVMQYPYDPAKAKALLDEMGWKPGSDGIRVKNGQRLSFNYSTQTESTNGREIQAYVQRLWHDVGVEADIKNAPTSLFFDNTTNGILQGGRYDVAAFAWSAAADPDDSSIYSGDNLAPHGQNALFWNNRIATKAMNDALQTVDEAKRKADYAVVQQQLAADVPTIILYFRKEPLVYNSDLKGFSASPVISPFWNPWEYSM
ncbi:MAG: peptide ABC transporter substrate-binding protein [Candidatus Velthaea sp.]